MYLQISHVERLNECIRIYSEKQPSKDLLNFYNHYEHFKHIIGISLTICEILSNNSLVDRFQIYAFTGKITKLSNINCISY